MNCDYCDEIISGPTRIDMLNGINVCYFAMKIVVRNFCMKILEYKK